MNNKPLVTVVMGVYNGQAALLPTLDSVFKQTDADFECIVVDDGSTDSTWAVLQDISAKEPRLRLHQQSHSGLTQALINGCSLARGEFIARQDVGDLSLPGRLRKQQELLMSNPGLAFVACQFVSVGPDGEFLSDPQPADGGRSIIQSLCTVTLDGMEVPHHGSVMFRRSLYEQVGGYRPEFYFAQDLDLWSRLIDVGDLAFVDQVLYQSRFKPGDISARHRPQQLLLRDLIGEATIARRNGKSEEAILEKASQIRKDIDLNAGKLDSLAEYFIGSCLLQRKDPSAKEYFRSAVKNDPYNFRAWAKLLYSSVLVH